MSLKDKGNAWKLVYAALVLTENAPKIEEGCYEDEDGNMCDGFFAWSTKDLKLNIKDIENEDIEFGKINLSEALDAFVNDYEKGGIDFPFKYESYTSNNDIIDTIEAYGLDVEQFWYAIVAIYWLTQKRCVNVVKPEGTTGEQMRKLGEYLQGIDRFTITAEGKKRLVIDDAWVIKSIRQFLDNQFAENELRFNDGYSININKQGNHLESSSVQMWFSAERYIKLFENLDLPTIRARDSEMKYYKRMDAGERIAKGGGNKMVSYNKMLLISRLMYFTRLTRNENFLGFDESLKGIIKQYKNLKINTYNPKYWF